jgi:hypothetical protein
MNRTFGLIAAVGLGFAVIAHALTFYPGPSIVTEEGSPVWWLHIGSLAVLGAMILSMRRQLGGQLGVANQMSLFPAWARALIVAAMIYMGFNFFSYFAHAQGGVPEIRNNQFVLNSHGAIRTLTEDEYLAFKRDDVRGFSGHWIFFFLVPTLYFLFGRRPQSYPSGGAR